MVNSKNKETLAPLGFDPDPSGPVGFDPPINRDKLIIGVGAGLSRLSRCIGDVSGF